MLLKPNALTSLIIMNLLSKFVSFRIQVPASALRFNVFLAGVTGIRADPKDVAVLIQT